jgi:hypothetical protein
MPLLYSFNASCRRQILALIQGKAFMKHDYVRTLHMAKDKLVENRRNLAAALAKADGGNIGDMRDKFVSIQETIEAVDRAIK